MSLSPLLRLPVTLHRQWPRLARRLRGLPPGYNFEKQALIDTAFERVAPRAVADLGGVWGIDGAYTFYTLGAHAPERALLVDTSPNDAVRARAHAHPNLAIVQGNFGDPSVIAKVGPLDLIYLFDVLLHQVDPDWDEVLRRWAPHTRAMAIFNQQWAPPGGPPPNEAVRLLDLGESAFFANVPHRPDEPEYVGLFARLDAISPTQGRPWRNVPNVWQWGITQPALCAAMAGLGFTLVYFKDCGPFGQLPAFRNHAYLFVKSL